MMRHTCRAAALTFFGVAFGSCQPEAANVERIRRLELENNIETTAGGRYLEAVARRSPLRELVTLLATVEDFQRDGDIENAVFLPEWSARTRE